MIHNAFRSARTQSDNEVALNILDSKHFGQFTAQFRPDGTVAADATSTIHPDKPRRLPVMSILTTEPEMLGAAAANLRDLGSTMLSRNAAAAAATMNVTPPAADEVSMLTAMHFAAHAAAFQQVFSDAMKIHEAFVSAMAACADLYKEGERTNMVGLA
ncbi:PE family protein [Mycobacterium attenuatum]